MKRSLLIFTLTVVALGLTAAAAAQSGALKLPPYKKIKLKNGMTVLLMERHTVPLIGFNVVVKAGSTADPAGKEGAASLAAGLLRKGSGTRNAEQFASGLDYIGGQYSAGANADYTFVAAEFPKKDVEKGLDLLADALMAPAFPQDEFAKLLKQRIDELKSAKDRPEALIGAHFNAYLFGSHPYGRPSTGDEKSLAAMSRDDVQKLYQTYYTPSNTILVAVGDFATDDLEKTLARKFESWPARQAPAVTVTAMTSVAGKKLLLIDKPDSTQTYYSIGNVGIARNNADRVQLRVVNTLFGGRFTSMLNSALRIKSGLTYGAGSTFDERKLPGPFFIRTYTKNATTAQAIDMTLDVLRQLHEKGVTEEELASAKNYIKGQFPPTIETAQQLASLLAGLEFNGLDEREINELYSRIDSMTLADARRVIHQYYPLDNLVFVVIGKASEIGGAVKKYAPKVETRSISDPGFGSPGAGKN